MFTAKTRYRMQVPSELDYGSGVNDAEEVQEKRS